MSSAEPLVIVVGAGPSGLLLSLLLAQNNIAVTLVEKSGSLDKQPRATHYAGPAVRVLHRAGVLDDIDAHGFLPNKLTFRTFDNQVLASIDHTGESDYSSRLRCLPLDQLGEVLLSHLTKLPNVTILWDHEVTELEDVDGVGAITVNSPQGSKVLRARYVVGCDRANSKIRRLLFGDWEFPRKTWETQIVATNRISYGVPISLTKKELLEQQPAKWKQMLPGHPSPEDYQITNFSPYKVHQRLAESMRKGPFILAADAAHLCNPFGGLGLTGGIVDVGGLVDCLLGIHGGKAEESILDIYSKVRREKYQQFIDPISSANLLRMSDKDPITVLHRDKGLQMIKSAESDPIKLNALINGIDVIEYDFTQHYK